MARSLMQWGQKPLVRIAHLLLLVLTITYLLWTIAAHAGDSWIVLRAMAPLPLIVAIFLGMAMTAASAVVFAHLARPGSKNFAEVMVIAEVFLLGQIIKYLPGRIWGAVYQVQRLASLLPRTQTTLAVLSHALLGGIIGLFSLGIAATASMFSTTIIITLLIFFEALMFTWVSKGMLTPWIQTLICKTFKSVGAAKHPMPIRSTVQIITMLNIEWGMYFMSWWLLAVSMHLAGSIDVFILASLYAGACLVGYLAVIFPAGLGVREGIFIALATGLGYSGDLALALAAAARLVLTLGEGLMSLLAVPLGRFFGRYNPDEDSA